MLRSIISEVEYQKELIVQKIAPLAQSGLEIILGGRNL